MILLNLTTILLKMFSNNNISLIFLKGTKFCFMRKKHSFLWFLNMDPHHFFLRQSFFSLFSIKMVNSLCFIFLTICSKYWLWMNSSTDFFISMLYRIKCFTIYSQKSLIWKEPIKINLFYTKWQLVNSSV